MELQYCPQWEKIKESFNRVWARENHERCIIQVTSMKPGHAEYPKCPERVEDRWLDFDYIRAVNEWRLDSIYYQGEAFPHWHANYPGWDFIPSYFGAPFYLGEDTGWHEHLMQEGELSDYNVKDHLTIKPDNKWWLFSQKMHKFSSDCAKGRAIPGTQAIGGTGDILAAMRSTNQLLYDVVDCPEVVREFELHIIQQWMNVYDVLYGITRENAEGSTNFMGVWGPGKCYITSNDFSYMISPEMYEEIFLPALLKQLDYLDQTIYHVDGEGAFRHVDLLCSIPKITGLQILPGAGKPSPLHYMEYLKKVQKAGKCLHISIPAEEVGIALDNLSSRGLIIQTGVSTPQEADDLVELCKKRSRFI